MTNARRAKILYSMKKRPSQARSRATTEAIIEAAARVLLTEGYDKASTNKIADIAGVSIGSVYEYFPGKEAIFAELRRRDDQRLYDLTMSREEPRTVREMLRSHVSLYLEFVRSNLALHSALLNDVPQFAIRENELPYYRDYVPWAVDFLRAHRGELKGHKQIDKTAAFVAHVTRATIDNYVLHAPEQLASDQVEGMMIELLESFLLAGDLQD